MDLLKNPFAILEVTPSDNRQRIIELSDERSLVIDADECAKARSILTHPRKRLSAEVAWLPGVDTKYVSEMCSLLNTSDNTPTNTFDTLSNQVLYEDFGVTSIALANFLAAKLSRMSISLPGIPNKLPQIILKIAQFFENVGAEELMDSINNDRNTAEFPEVTDISLIEAEIQERRRYYVDVIKSVLDSLSSEDLVSVLTEIVKSGKDDAIFPYVLSDILDIYEAAAQSFFEKEAKNVSNLVQAIKEGLGAKRPDSALKEKIDQLIQVIRNWSKIAQPLILRAKSIGIEYNRALTILEPVRSLSLFVNNEHRKAEFSLSLTLALKDNFFTMNEVVELLDQDVRVLEGLLKQKRKNVYEAEIGLLVKETIRISEEGITWKGRLWKLNDVTRIRWGGTRTQHGFITSTTYTVFWGTNAEVVSVNVREAVYKELVRHLWDTIGTCLFVKYLEGLQSGKSYRFASALISDFGIEMERRKFFSTEQIFCPWGNIVLFNGNGTFCIGSKNDKNLSASFSYLQDENTHVLEAMLRKFWEHGGYRHKLSSLLTIQGR